MGFQPIALGGYKFLFTPDYRGGGLLDVPGLTITDCAVRTVTDTLAVSEVIDKQDHLRLNTWQVVAGIGQIGSLGAATISINNLAPGNRVIPTTLVDMALSPTVESEMDYLTGHIEDGNLRLDVWRVAAEPGFREPIWKIRWSAVPHARDCPLSEKRLNLNSNTAPSFMFAPGDKTRFGSPLRRRKPDRKQPLSRTPLLQRGPMAMK